MDDMDITAIEALDEYPDLSRFIRYLTDEGGVFNAAVFGGAPEQWQRMLQRVGVYARRAAQEVAVSGGKLDDIIKPMWDDTGRVLHGIRRMSGDAYLDLLQLEGHPVNPEAYRDPPAL